MTSPLFAPHGQRSLSVEDRLIVVHSRGPWNAEFVHEGHVMMLKAIESMAGKPWMLLGMIYGEGLQTPEAYAAQVASIQAQRPLGRKGTALVLVDKGASSFFVNFYRDMYAAANEPVTFFADEASARAWLATQLEALGETQDKQ